MEPFTFTPADGRGKVYTFRRPTFAEKTYGFRRAVHAAGGVYHGEFELLAVAEQGVNALLAAEQDTAQRAEWLAAIANYRRLLQSHVLQRKAEREAEIAVLPPKSLEELTEAERAAAAEKLRPALERALALNAAAVKVEALGAILRRGWARYAEMEADRAAYFAIRGSVACRMFLAEVSAADAGGDPQALWTGAKPSDAEIERHVGLEHVEAIGVWCSALFEPDETQRKNSASPSATSPTATTAKNSATSLH